MHETTLKGSRSIPNYNRLWRCRMPCFRCRATSNDATDGYDTLRRCRNATFPNSYEIIPLRFLFTLRWRWITAHPISVLYLHGKWTGERR